MAGVNVKTVLKALEKNKSNVKCSVTTSRLVNNDLLEIIRNALRFSKYDGFMMCQLKNVKLGIKFVYDKNMRAGKVMFAVLVPHKASDKHKVQTMYGFAIMPAPKSWKLIVIREDKLLEEKGVYSVALSRPVKKEYEVFNKNTDAYNLVVTGVNFFEQFSRKFFRGVLKAESLVNDWPEIEEKKVEFFIKVSEFIVQFVENALKFAEVEKPVKPAPAHTPAQQEQVVKSVSQSQQTQVEQEIKKEVKEQEKKDEEKDNVPQPPLPAPTSVTVTAQQKQQEQEKPQPDKPQLKEKKKVVIEGLAS